MTISSVKSYHRAGVYPETVISGQNAGSLRMISCGTNVDSKTERAYETDR